MTEARTTWRGALDRSWPLVVAVFATLVINPAIGAVAAVVLALWRWSRDRPVAMALVAAAVLAFAYVFAFAVTRVG